MKIYIDRQKVNARASAANLASVGGLMVLLVSIVISLFVPRLAALASFLLIAGIGIAMVGIYFANRWVRKPRPEESLDKVLKSFDEHYHLYHYPSSLACDHILLTPNGILALEVVNLSGSFAYRNGRWKEAMTIGRALRYIVEERVADPLLLAQALTTELTNRFGMELGEKPAFPINVLSVFSHPAVDLEMEGTAFPACKIDKLRKRVNLNGPRLTPDLYEKLSSFLERITVN